MVCGCSQPRAGGCQACNPSWLPTSYRQVPTVTTGGTVAPRCVGCGDRIEVWWSWCAMCGKHLAAGNY